MKDKCLILGGDGFIGSHLAERLVAEKYRVRIFDRFKNNKAINVDHLSQRVDLFKGDFLETDSLRKAVKGFNYVFHLVSTTNPASSMADPLFDIETNLKGSLELFKLLSSEKSVKKVIFISSGGAIYGENEKSLHREDDAAYPISPYAINKLAIERYLGYFRVKEGLDHLIIRASNPYGPRQNVIGTQGVIPIFLNMIKEGKQPIIFGDGENKRDYIYISDLIKGIAVSFKKKTKKSIYNLGSGKGTTLNELIDLMRQVTKRSINPEYLPARSSDIRSIILDISRFRREFNWTPQVDLLLGIRKTWDYLLSL